MNWRIKALVQNTVALLPPRLANAAYYLLQRTLGSLRRPEPTSRIVAGVAMLSRLDRLGREADGAVFFELGTGHQLNLPIALWLGGASAVVTVDLNRYLKPALVRGDLQQIAAQHAQIRELFESHQVRLREDRLHELCRLAAGPASFEQILVKLAIDYRAPCDARSLPLEPGRIDYFVSYNVLEHIPEQTIREILRDARRVLRPEGLMIHDIDLSDHFSHYDRSLSPINFLRFDERQWQRWAGNPFMYMNRLRADDFDALFAEEGLGTVLAERIQAPAAATALKEGLVVDRRFAGKSLETLTTTRACHVLDAGASARTRPTTPAHLAPPDL